MPDQQVALVARVPLPAYGKKALFSPSDGGHVLVTGRDGGLSIFELGHGGTALRPCCRVSSPDVAVLDAAWYPGGQCFAATSKHQPCLLRDLEGKSRASYVSYNAADEPETTLSLSWAPDGSRLFGTSASGVAHWDPSRPGRPVSVWDVRRSRVDGVNAGPLRPLNGVLSCSRWSAEQSLLAVGSYGGNVGLFGAEGRLQHVLKKAQKNGVTQLAWCGQLLLVGGRRSTNIVAYDARQLEQPLRVFEREAATHQHIDFAVSGDKLLSGDTSEPAGLVSVWSIDSGEKLADLPLHRDVVACVDVHPLFPQLLATATGRRNSPDPENCFAIHHVS